MTDTNSDEFKDLFAAWVHALKTLDMRLQTYYAAIAALENHPQFKFAAPYFKEAVIANQTDPILLASMDHKYDLASQQCERLLQQSNWQEALASWLREYQLETPKSASAQS